MASTTTTDRISPPGDPLTQAKVMQWKLDTRLLAIAKVKKRLSRAGLEDSSYETRVIHGKDMPDELNINKLVEKIQDAKFKDDVEDPKSALLEVLKDILRIVSKQNKDEDKINKKLIATERFMAQAQARGEVDQVPRALSRARHGRSFTQSSLSPFFPGRDTLIWLDKEAMTINSMPMPEEEEAAESE
ncbi:hypothetical protein KC349_g7722 [Hortaea werneckii]|nr:hypothetical protein KC349_g7722 [Hortaea werneckii]